ncbi:hypothetical protein [Bradyrhizobium sp. CIR3A]|uniref:hypothetical protein n=1 Tax=Bradyrhizobium sp. CIR3A TaxID=2663838 RepID=UPI0016062839|nr:hypothetical protein [Bradyrhizobium sp. CIR3A]MBB4263030.1 hypothetical protein [Bradyrhizobium sp. CIR3A]
MQDAGGRSHLEYWIPAEDLDAFNAALVAVSEVVESVPWPRRPITRNFLIGPIGVRVQHGPKLPPLSRPPPKPGRPK